jgi:Ca2+-binding EF-hand superfamily protein
MKTILLTAVAAFTLIGAADAMGRGAPLRLDENGDRALSLEEVSAPVLRRFEAVSAGDGIIDEGDWLAPLESAFLEADGDGDAALSLNELRAYRTRVKETAKAAFQEARNTCERPDVDLLPPPRIFGQDTSDDSFIQLEESQTQRMEKFAELDTNANGLIDEGEFLAPVAERFAERDSDGDGLLTLQEILGELAGRRDGARFGQPGE